MGKRWTADEKDFLRRNWRGMKAEDIAKKLNRTILAVRRRAGLLHVYDRRGVWSEEELSILKKLWIKRSPIEIAKLLNRTVNAVEQRGHMLKLKFGSSRERPTCRRGSFALCPKCGKRFYLVKSLVGKQKYCSFSCFLDSEDGRDKLRKRIRDSNRIDGPNKSERFLSELLEKYFPNEYLFNGDYSKGVTLGGLVPDFININGKKQVIELFGDYWHNGKQDIPWKSTEFGRQAVFSQLGFSCLIIWEHELKSPDEVIEKIRKFNK